MKNIHNKIKTELYLKLLICWACYFVCVTGYSQKPEVCGGYKINYKELEKALGFEKTNPNKSVGNTHYLIKVYVHIIRNDDGSNAGATEAQVQNELDELAISYLPDNICFIKMGLSYINSSTLNTMHLDDGASVDLLKSHNVPTCLNIYYHNEIVGAGGYAYGIPSTFCSIKTSNLGTFTTSHEVGHCFGLLHTFETGYGYEDIDGSNGSTAADLIADTHADPWAYLGQACFPELNCVYNGSCTDPKGQKNFSPPYYNTMCYWYVACSDYRGQSAVETQGQFMRINSFLSTNADLQACESPANVTLGNIISNSGYLMTSAVNSLTTSGTVMLNGTTIATLGGQTVFLENGFSAIPSNGGLISIEPASCKYTFNKMFVINSSNVESKIENKSNFELNVYPNPTSSVVRVQFNTTILEPNVFIRVYDNEMRMVKEIKIGDLINGKQNVAVNLNGLTSGMYLIVIQLTSKKLASKVLLVK